MTNDIEWKMVKLGDVCQIKDGTHQTPHYVENGKQFYSVENVTNNDFSHTKYISESEHKKLTATYRIEKGDVLMTRIGSIGVCKYIDWDVDASFYVSLALLKCNKTFINPRYFVFYSQTKQFREEILSHSLQFAIPMKINLGKISDVLISIPYKNGSPDLETQKQIAQKLGDMDSLIATEEKLLAKKRNLKVAAMQKLIKDEESENWKKVKLGDSCKIGDGLHGTPTDDDYGNCAFFINGNNLVNGSINITDGTDLVSELFYKKKKINFSNDTVFLSINGTIGNVALYSGEKIILGKSVAYFDILKNLETTFLYYVLQSDLAKKYFENLLTGSTIKNLGLTGLRELKIPIPFKNGTPDINEQRRIASILSDMDSEISAIEKEITKLQNLKTAMMQKMFCFEDSDSSSE